MLLLRGALSDLLSPVTMAEMQSRLPRLEAVEVPNRGHAPTLDEPVARQAIDDFLRRLDGR
jgi:pimeloyl-ACP methyl ester carboxylesterase